MFGLGLTTKLEDKIADLESTIFYLRTMNANLRNENINLKNKLQTYRSLLHEDVIENIRKQSEANQSGCNQE